MNIFTEIFLTKESVSSDSFFFNTTAEEIVLKWFPVDLITILLVVPINIYVIWLIVTGTGNGLAAEFFTLNLSICEILISTQSPLDALSYLENLWNLSVFLEGLNMTGRPVFQCLMCVERYLAVVHPVIFLKFKPLRYRVICSVIAWVAGFGSGVFCVVRLMFPLFEVYFWLLLVELILFFSIQLFCLVAVLRALKQSGPGERGREREEENLMKRRAFHLILITTVTMVIMYTPFIISFYFLGRTPYILLVFSYVFFIYCGLVQPLLFLYRVKKPPFINCQ